MNKCLLKIVQLNNFENAKSSELTGQFSYKSSKKFFLLLLNLANCFAILDGLLSQKYLYLLRLNKNICNDNNFTTILKHVSSVLNNTQTVTFKEISLSPNRANLLAIIFHISALLPLLFVLLSQLYNIQLTIIIKLANDTHLNPPFSSNRIYNTQPV